MTKSEVRELIGRVRSNKYLMRSETDYITKALEEVQQYRAIGTPEELQEMKKDFAEALSDWRQYRKIGTLEECRAAM